MDDKRLNLIVERILEAVRGAETRPSAEPDVPETAGRPVGHAAEPDVPGDGSGEVFEIAPAKDDGLALDNPSDPGALVRMKSRTPARIGVGKAGARLKTSTMLRLRADHAAARDAVFTDVSDEILESAGLKTFQTLAKDKNEFLTSPGLGRRFAPETLAAIAAEAGTDRDVLVYAADGLSSTAIDANVRNILPVITDGLRQKNVKVAKPFFVRYGRVGSEDAISEAVRCRAICVLIGERPGLATAESMSAYICYEAKPGQPESRRTVVSNIHRGGTPAIEAGAYITDVIMEILKSGKSGVELKKQGDTL